MGSKVPSGTPRYRQQLTRGRKKFKKKSYVLGKDPFDEVYKGDCLTLRGQNASFPRYDNFFANFCQKVPHFEGL